MRAFVTGGSGYIGNAVVAALRRTAAPIGSRAIARLSPKPTRSTGHLRPEGRKRRDKG